MATVNFRPAGCGCGGAPPPPSPCNSSCMPPATGGTFTWTSSIAGGQPPQSGTVSFAGGIWTGSIQSWTPGASQQYFFTMACVLSVLVVTITDSPQNDAGASTDPTIVATDNASLLAVTSFDCAAFTMTLTCITSGTATSAFFWPAGSTLTINL